MSSFSRAALVAVCLVTLLIASDVILGRQLSSSSRASYAVAMRIALYTLGVIAASTAASRAGWLRAHVGVAWTLFALEFALLLLNYVLRQSMPDAAAALHGTLIAANVAQVAAYWLMSRVLSAAGFGFVIPPERRILLTVAALGVAIALCHVSLLTEWQMLRSGAMRPGALVSVIADVLTFTLTAPLATSAIALRGGSLSWMLGLLTLSVVGWMVNTGAPSIAALFAGGDETLRAIRMAGVVIATVFNAAAAATQSIAATHAMRSSYVDA